MTPLARRTHGRRKFRRGHAPYLTKIRFFWCDSCNVPRLSESDCSICGKPSRKVDLSPPGDPFPAMDGHVQRVINAVDSQFGEGVARKIFPDDKTIVMNKISSLDAMYEVIVDGTVLGRLRFDIPKRGYTFILSLEGGRRIGHYSKQKWVSCHDEVLKFLKGGANLLVPGIAGCDSGILVNDEVWVINSYGLVIAVGTARMSGDEMATSEKGFAIKIRDVSDPLSPEINPQNATWDTAVEANAGDIQKIEDEATAFIKRTLARNEAQVVVGFSGGKDSLVTYLLVEKALGISPPLFFMNTGIELPETLNHITEFAEQRGVPVIGFDAKDRFWNSLDSFGPPARDFRWCCKVLKLGPAATTISEKLGGETLTFMGQRKLESFQRSIEPRVTTNPWVPGQVSANPIQNWNALEVWLYIFHEKVPFNPLYAKGYHRIGCYLCPSAPLAEIEGLKETHPQLYERWKDQLVKWSEKLGYPQEWVDLGFWRWKRLPNGQMNLIEQLGLDIQVDRPGPSDILELNVVKGVSPCTEVSGLSLEGQFSMGINLPRAAKLLPIFGTTKLSEKLGALRIKSQSNTISLFSSGSLVIRGKDESLIDKTSKQIERAVKRALFCQACGSCIPQCEHGALILVDQKITVDTEKCTNCLKCDTWPCPTYLT
ncbi:MAG: phosphoadenosine phosphosulfate reductase domain-containing protein [Candidatus Thorarchaeota archaeon]